MRFILICGAAAIIAGILGLIGGAAIVHYDTGLYRWTESVRKQVADYRRGTTGITYYDSVFARLEERKVKLPFDRPNGGGALAVLGDRVVLISQDGVYAASGPEDVERIDITPPDNGIAAYRAAAETERYSKYEHNFDWLRYNDIFILEGGNALRFFVSFTRYFAEGECYRTVVADHQTRPGVTSLDDVSIGSDDWVVLYQTEPCLPLKPMYRAIEGLMAGGRMAYDGDGRLYLASGEYHWDGIYAENAVAQLDDYDYGKVIEIDIAARSGRVITKGHRNMQGIAFDRSGDLYVVEHGFRGGDELNRIVAGRDYGFPSVTLGTLYSNMPVPNTITQGRHDLFEPPVFAWLPSVAISSLVRIEGFHDTWDGDLLMGTLKDGSLYRIRTVDGRIRFAERIQIGERIRYAIQLGDQLVLYTDSGLLMFLRVAGRSFAQDFYNRYFRDSKADPQLRTRIQEALTTCRGCHSLDTGDNLNGPSLGGVFGAEVAAGGFAGYSNALRDHGGRWTREALTGFITDPNGFAEGTSMPDPGVDDPEVVAGVVDFLEALSNTEAYAFRRDASDPAGSD